MGMPMHVCKSDNSEVLSKIGFQFSVNCFNKPGLEKAVLKDIARHNPQGILVLVTNEREGVYRVRCLNALYLHYCVSTDSIAEVLLNERTAWPYLLDDVAFFEFIPIENFGDVDLLKYKICTHLTALLVEEGAVKSDRRARYFHEVSYAAGICSA
ncbi:hypothetical protein N0036_08495 [Pseudomonas aeruginosa]|uniref:hypothetical protein n=1 Tax=Pseudomonas aeruginosa TaxID=287 RepID=UPI000F54659E|nr:hypothetical protein [Pseudomonas aeruginosa]MCO2025802.1 hypothetical protein [Pseudomonas aeruginosa]MCS7675675.1 hypothetical protein [Pseudomonas aeruginosa]MCS7904982.1 hypothetical protein [Pseudomonas aeruginosa]MCS9345745.1 hypothetical protein [Pseudomonas aeruginosa]MCS9358584.1 hypothetical protein [Pseudomonas aeruginosa]